MLVNLKKRKSILERSERDTLQTWASPSSTGMVGSVVFFWGSYSFVGGLKPALSSRNDYFCQLQGNHRIYLTSPRKSEAARERVDSTRRKGTGSDWEKQRKRYLEKLVVRKTKFRLFASEMKVFCFFFNKMICSFSK